MLSRFRSTPFRAFSLTMILSLLGFTVALAASGGLDATFSGDGKLTTDFLTDWQESAMGLAVQSNAKIVAVGMRYDPANTFNTTNDFALARYNTNGSLDTSFSGDGRQVTNFGAAEEAEDVAIQSDGKIVVSGMKCAAGPSYACDLAVARYKTDGSLDGTFSGDGKQTVSFGTHNGTHGGLAIQSDGKIVIGGWMVNSASNFDFAVYRLNPNGSLDTTFSGDGKVNIGFGAGRNDQGSDLVLQGGKIVIAGETCDAGGYNCDFAVARLTTGGALDPTFSADGRQRTNFGAEEYAFGLAKQADGRIVAAGQRGGNIALARYKTDGSLDGTFSGDGKLTLTYGATSSAADVLVQADGKIMVAGETWNGANYDFAILRLNPGGSLDTTFSGDGRTRVDFAGMNDHGYAMVRQSDGKYVLGGGSAALGGAHLDFALARLLP